MKKGFLRLLAYSSVSLLMACGSSTDGNSVLGLPQTDSARQEYSVLGADLQVYESFDSKQSVLIPAGTEVSVLEQITNDQGQQWVRLGIEDQSEFQDLPSDVWVPLENLMKNSLMSLSDPLYLSDEDEISEDFSRKMTYCYRYVKQYLLKQGLVKVYLPGVSAYMAANILPKHGFQRVSRGPKSPRVNDVCVYRGGPSGHGHIEVWTSKGWWYGYGYKSQPIKNRTLISCFAK